MKPNHIPHLDDYQTDWVVSSSPTRLPSPFD